eukprot:TRINITY_DN8123_c0_g1_i1.p1 TRINITY_DN8123_c0_g1~~TRINITY_DN8123_c0_g1_i1.p1  ORF type:complete len:251 (+),score=20.43 TRINITY_DN8123_c0_g1_i1:106-858(+)
MSTKDPKSSGNDRKLSSIFTIDNLRKIQAGSGLFLGTFVSMHLVETISAYYGPFAYDEALNFFRLYYHHPVIESLLATSAVAHVLSGWYLYSKRQTPASQLNVYQNLNNLSGMWLSMAISIHFGGARFPSLVLGEDFLPDFSFNTHSFRGLSGLFFYPWYFALALCGTYHSLYSSIKALANLKVVSPVKTTKILHSKYFIAVVSIVSAMVLSGVIAFTDGLWFTPTREKDHLWDTKLAQTFSAIGRAVFG